MRIRTRMLATLTVLLTLLMIQGCGVSKSEMTFGSGDQLRNSRGHGTGRVFGVNLEVIEAGGTNLNANQVSEEGTTVDGTRVKGGTRCEIEMGEVRVTLVKSSNGEIDMSVDGKAYGRVKAGDSVVVDKARTVAVNGAPRKSQ